MKELIIKYNHPISHPREVTLKNGEIWKLEGECNRCGDCCEHINIPELVRDTGQGCKHLSYETWDGKEVSSCNIYWIRPCFCALYPRDPNEELFPNCSYKWVRVK